MCGLVGRLSYHGAEGAGGEETERRLLALVRRRGPDDEGVWSDGERCTLGFRRLAIIDPSAASRQPMCTADGRYALVCNGALYNFRELRVELERAGVHFRSNGDTEVVLNALVAWGRGALQRFNGMFALALYDVRARRVLLARDHAGMKPLYYLLAPRGVVFASQYDQILTHPWSRDAGEAPEAVGLYLRLGYIPAPYALLRGTHLVDAGGWVEIDAGGRLDRGRFFEFPVHREPDLSGEDAEEAVAAAVTAAVRRHLIADVPLGVFLSGGIDSPLVAATMRAVGADPVRAFTLGTGGDEFDESEDAAAYAGEIGAAHNVGHLTPSGALELLDDVDAACAEPFADYSIFPTLFVSRLARQQVKVALSGDGGDELFWGYAGRSGVLLDRLESAGGRRNAASGKGWDWVRLLAAGRRRSDGRWPASVGDLQRLSHTRAADGWLRRVFPDLPPWPEACSLFAYDGWELDRTAQWLRWNEFTAYLPMLLQKVDRGSMFHSLEMRVPLLDREVIEVATRIHWRACLDPTRRLGKLPLRRVLARHVRHHTWAKRGFTVPMDAWLRGPLRPVFEETVLAAEGIAGLAVSRRALGEMFERHLQGRSNSGWGLWVLLSLCLWERRHYDRRGTFGADACAS
jgi:asparagine synthase (glutamine-hydrolysing)